MPELIDKAKLLEYLSAIKPDEYVSAYGEAAVDVINHVEEYVAEMPTIEPEVRHGRWAKAADKQYCTECRAVTKVRNAPFCWHCGAKIDLCTPTEVQLDEADSVMMGGADNDT